MTMPTEFCKSSGQPCHIPRSVISAKVRLALLWRSMFSENTKVLKARRGSPEKKSVSPRCEQESASQLTKRSPITDQNGLMNQRFRDTVTSQRQPRARCQQELVHTSPRETGLEKVASANLVAKRRGQVRKDQVGHHTSTA